MAVTVLPYTESNDGTTPELLGSVYWEQVVMNVTRPLLEELGWEYTCFIHDSNTGTRVNLSILCVLVLEFRAVLAHRGSTF